MMHPRYEVEREYAVRVMGTLTRRAAAVAADRHRARGRPGQGREARGRRRREGANHWYHVVLKEGRNREVRRLFEALGLTVSRLIRTRYGTVAMPSRVKRGADAGAHAGGSRRGAGRRRHALDRTGAAAAPGQGATAAASRPGQGQRTASARRSGQRGGEPRRPSRRATSAAARGGGRSMPTRRTMPTSSNRATACTAQPTHGNRPVDELLQQRNRQVAWRDRTGKGAPRDGQRRAPRAGQRRASARRQAQAAADRRVRRRGPRQGRAGSRRRPT